MDLLGIKTWLLGHLVMILGIALASTVSIVAFDHFVRIPMLKNEVKEAKLDMTTWKNNTTTALDANKSLALSADRCSKSVASLAATGEQNAADTLGILNQLRGIGKETRAALNAYKPDPTKTACENAAIELGKLRKERGQ